MTIEFSVPGPHSVDLPAALAEISQGSTSQPFNAPALALLAELSHILLNDAETRQYADLVALGFALRGAEIERLRAGFELLSGTGRCLQPRGTVFQIAAGNVDTLFIHAWIFALLTGNRSIIRLPSRQSPQSDFLCAHLNQLLGDKPELGRTNHFIRYGHEREITAALSAACDVRAVWGGDATVNAIRSIPLGPYGKELAFPDRYSMAAISSEAYRLASAASKEKLTRDFFNDAFLFDQMACSSPRLVIWCGEEKQNEQAAGRFFAALENEAVRRGHAVEPSTKMRKFLYACEAAIQQPVTAYVERQHTTVLPVAELENLRREHCGGGLFLQFQTPSLASIACHLTRQDQTLVYFGFDQPELNEFARFLNGRALDRIVPIGQALSFSRFWDGYDLLTEFTRSVAIQ
jgi:hypothetical protein